jgi:cysteinyl-tRNA synthetase
MTELKLFNSLTRSLETFVPIHDGEARVYTCGPTVYNYPHIGNMRAYIFADTLGRVLRYKGYKLTHVINITDVGHLTDDADAGEDKMEKMAADRAQSIWDIAKHYTEAYWTDFKALNCTQPAQWTTATDYVPKMIEFAQSIADKHCYEIDSGLYFDVSTVPDYGRLARATTDEGHSRIDPVPGKRQPQDFAIWRKTPEGETRQMEWDSPWGRGAPGWHLECSVMSGEVLGFPFDIHTGGIDHREVHHPCEIAQNQAFHGDADPGATIWMHNNWLIDRSQKDSGAKMSKSSGEFLRLQLLIDKGFHPLAFRLMCLQAHYRSELEFSWEGLQAAFVRLKRMVMGVAILKARHAELVSASIAPHNPQVEAEKWTLKQVQGDVTPAISSLVDDFTAAVEDDLNTAIAITALEALIGLKKMNVVHQLAAIEAMDAAVGLNLLTSDRTELRVRPNSAQLTVEHVEASIAFRKELRAQQNYPALDRNREDLIASGVEVMDGDPLGWDWKIEI